MLKIENLTKKLENKLVIDHVTFSMQTGQIVGLVGRNGVGKTTLFRLLSGEYLSDSGGVSSDDAENARTQIFYLDAPDNFTNAYSAAQLARIFKVSYPKLDVEWFESLVKTNNLPLHKKMSSLSKGQRGLILVIAAITSKARYIFLDEPLDGLDLIVRDQVTQMLISAVSDNQTGIMLASHNLRELDTIADRIILIKEGRIEKDYLPGEELETANVAKMQMVIEGALPKVVIECGHILEKRGHLYVVLFKDYDSKMAARIKRSKAKYIEELPVNSDDIFRATFDEDYRLRQAMPKGRQ
ncbi:ABC transporter ATP-binding protein [Oenococcus kitaharae]|uniref:ABC transporter ATP-binding protein n=1 Tax=Oenococcus kitaharae DSM 17330 TaxID=1045004 RepID=G9WJ80_9LACO|nr:ABC transporter ATP-binding protein [Oenococcus kitaharae]EHN58686.1 ABC transporter ATP-binding protein [Oenococcus kitaharae DSM 17330]OEY83227.1 multidrug ABC transporter ATPase [Oenococcus kitaharae]OEY84250.1 multidrug ABC transporter ATPase [Oenococcus kitaharae]OEY85843.1 multidrug ABC transporter ATPase [Oenococcus kitaharae]